VDSIGIHPRTRYLSPSWSASEQGARTLSWAASWHNLGNLGPNSIATSVNPNTTITSQGLVVVVVVGMMVVATGLMVVVVMGGWVVVTVMEMWQW